jgi:ribosomal protein L37AE/L43A
MNFEELMMLLEDLKKEGKFVDVQLCPRCKSTKVKRVGSMGGDMSGQIALTLPKFECQDCGWRGRQAIYATNRPLDKKMMAVVSDSSEWKKGFEDLSR